MKVEKSKRLKAVSGGAYFLSFFDSLSLSLFFDSLSFCFLSERLREAPQKHLTLPKRLSASMAVGSRQVMFMPGRL